MPETAFNTVGCPGCRKRFVWKPELAGQAVRCTCGHAFVIGDAPENLPLNEPPPAKAPPAPGSIRASDFELPPTEVVPIPRAAIKCPSCNLPMRAGAAVCLNCGYDLRAKERVKTRVNEDDEAQQPAHPAAAPVPLGDASAAPPAPAHPSHPLIRDAAAPPPLSGDFAAPAEQPLPPAIHAPRSGVGRALANREDDAGDSRFIDFHLPILFLTLGTVFSVFVPVINGKPFAAGLFYMAFQLVVKVPVMLTALMLAARLLDISYGPLTTTLLKLAGIAMGPMALANLILGAIVGATMGFGIWLGVFFYIVIAGIPLSYMFDIDMNETIITMVVIIVTEMAFNFFLLALMLAMFG